MICISLCICVDITEGGVSCFQEKDPELGFAQFISYKDFYNPSNGFLICDSCVFGVELFVLHSMVDQNPSKDAYPIECSNIFTWDVNKFSEREHWLYIESEMFEAGGMPWYVYMRAPYFIFLTFDIQCFISGLKI